MEFRLNKIDTDLRRKLMEETKDGKVRKYEKVHEDPDVVRARKEKQEKEEAEGQKRYITIDGIKYGDEVSVKAELEENGQVPQGIFLDTKK